MRSGQPVRRARRARSAPSRSRRRGRRRSRCRPRSWPRARGTGRCGATARPGARAAPAAASRSWPMTGSAVRSGATIQCSWRRNGRPGRGLAVEQQQDDREARRLHAPVERLVVLEELPRPEAALADDEDEGARLARWPRRAPAARTRRPAATAARRTPRRRARPSAGRPAPRPAPHPANCRTGTSAPCAHPARRSPTGYRISGRRGQGLSSGSNAYGRSPRVPYGDGGSSAEASGFDRPRAVPEAGPR